jgi:hypothetical protein
MLNTVAVDMRADFGFHFTHWICEKWSEEACDWVRKKLWLPKLTPVPSFELRRLVGAAEVVEEVPGNLLLNAGIAHILDQLHGATTDPLNNANCRLGVGNSATAEAATQTDLQAAAGAANRQFKLMNATFPSRSAQTESYQSDYTSGEANFIWNEWGVDNGNATGTTVVAPMINRKVASLGTKATGTWTLTGTLTLS